MHDQRHWQPPPVPPDRRHRGDEWARLWRLAHEQMHPWGRAPSPHLIDRLVDDARVRGILALHLGDLAAVTLTPGTHVQPGGRRRWDTQLLRRDTMNAVQVSIVLEDDHYQIVTAFLR